MTFVFQQPGAADLLRQIDIAAKNAVRGGGVFAFASKGGVEALFACRNFANMLTQQQPFHLIVGIDAVTNAETLLCLAEKKSLFHGALTVEAFYHENPSSTFHPKFSWFEQDGDLCLLTGSGNLTLRGIGQISSDAPLSGNWEAFSVQKLRQREAATVLGEINAWLAVQRENDTLLSITDGRVRDKAMANGRVRFATPQRRTTPGESQANPITVSLDGVTFDSPEIAIRELPRNRPGQADVGQAILQKFFGYEKFGVNKTILLQHVTLLNELEPSHEVQMFVNQSRNFRLELSAMGDLKYEVADDDSRMLMVATKFDCRSFRYAILPVTTPAHRQVLRLLGPVPPVSGRRRAMREKHLTPDELLSAWPDAPPNLLPLNLLMPEP